MSYQVLEAHLPKKEWSNELVKVCEVFIGQIGKFLIQLRRI
jgi:hypothetical protein